MTEQYEWEDAVVDDTRTERINFRVSPDEREAVDAAAAREGVTVSDIAREAMLRRARRPAGCMDVRLDPPAARRVRAAAAVDDVDPVQWASATIEAAAARRVASEGLSSGVGATIESDGGDDHE